MCVAGYYLRSFLAISFVMLACLGSFGLSGVRPKNKRFELIHPPNIVSNTAVNALLTMCIHLWKSIRINTCDRNPRVLSARLFEAAARS